MQIDYYLIKRLLNVMQSKESHFISISKLLEEAKPEFEEMPKNDYINQVYGHLQLLKDEEVIKEVLGTNLGISYTANGDMQISGCYIRMTSKGYDFLKTLNKNNMLEKLKNFTLNEALNISRAVLSNTVSNCIANFT